MKDKYLDGHAELIPITKSKFKENKEWTKEDERFNLVLNVGTIIFIGYIVISLMFG